MKIASRILVLSVLGFLFAVSGIAQTQPNLENGFKHWGSYDSSQLDTVNLQNGNLILHAPLLPAYPQRGKFGLQDVLSFNSKAWQVTCQIVQGDPATPICGWIRGGTGVALQRSVDLAVERVDESYNSGTGVQAYTSLGYTLISPDGATHQLMVLEYGPTPPFETASPKEMETVDTTGYHVTMSGADSNGVPNIATVTDRHGNQYVATFKPFGGATFCPSLTTLPTNQLPGLSFGGGYFAPLRDDSPMGFLDCPQIQGAYKVTDSNGNFMNLFDPAGATSGGADTLGRALPLETGTAAPDNTGCPTPSSGYGPRLSNYSAPDGTTRQVKLCFGTVATQTAFNVSVPNGSGGTIPVQEAQNSGLLSNPFSNPLDPPNTLHALAAVILADGTSWNFTYDGYGEITNVALPTGGSISYTWTTISTVPGCSALWTNWSRAVATRTLHDGRGNSYTWSYSWGSAAGGVVTNKVTDPLGNDTTHTFTALDGPNRCAFFETGTKYYQGAQSPASLMRQVDTTYYPVGLFATYSGDNVPMNVVAKDITTTLYPSQKTSKIHREYDAGLGAGLPIFGSVKKEFQYDWGQGAPGALLKETDTTYQWEVNSAYLTAHLLDLPASVIVYDGNHNRMAETDYLYDEPAYLTNTTITTQHDTPPSSVRGNLTTVKRWVNTTGAFITSHTNWYDTGEPHQQIDALGHTTTLSYDLFYKGAYVTQTCSPSTAGNTIAHCVSGTYDFNTGVLTSLTGENATTHASGNTPGDSAHTSNFAYDFNFRLTSGQAPPDPANSNARAQTSLTFSAANVLPLTVTRTKSITNALTDSATATFDGLARNYKTQHLTPDGNVSVDTVFDAAGRVSTVSNPYFSTSDPTYGLTQNQYDGLDRVTQVTKQDSSVSVVAYNVITGAHDLTPGNGNLPGDCTDTTDEAGKLRRTCSDALGRLVTVIEPNPGATATTATGSVTINGTEQTTPTATPSTGTVSISGSDQSATSDPCAGQEPPSSCPFDYWDTGTVTLTVNGRSYGAGYDNSSTGATIAAALAGQINADSGRFVNATASGGVITLTSSTAGSSTNYAFSSSTSSSNASVFGGGSFFGTSGALAGGHNAGMADSGTITAIVNGTSYQVTFGSGDTGAAIATRLASAMNASPVVTAAASGNQVNLTSRTAGGAGNATLTSSYTWNSSLMAQPSFTTAVTGVAGGYDAGVLDNNPYKTLYFYDALGNLLCVEQHGSAAIGTGCSDPPTSDATSPWRVRRFTYDSVSRLLTAANPESGVICYGVWQGTACVGGYDDDGEMLMKTSPAPNQTGSATQTVSHCYDELHRATKRDYQPHTYNPPDCPITSPVVTYVYDTGTNGIGHLTSLTDQAGTASYNFDILGRLSSETRVIAGISKTISYDYNLDGSLKALHYPSGSVVTYTPDSAGRTVSAVDIANAINYVTGATYGPDGAPTGFISGHTASFNGITNSFSYNKRLQPVSMSAASPSQTVFSIGYDFHFGNGDNGNVFGITNAKDTTRNQTFAYDVLNRLILARNAGTDCTQTALGGLKKFWGNNYVYDAWGNLLQKSSMTNTCSGEGLGVNVGFNNRISSAGYAYDASGNMTNDGLGHNYTYDQENRITGAAGYTYVYDADGNRVKKSNTSTGTLYWYMTPGIVAESDLMGTLKSEYVFFGGERVARRDLAAPTGVLYYFSDHLKTASVITDAAGNIKAESDYYPWGGELQFVNADSNRYKFTGKERDAETGLDYFGARYFSNVLGRWVSADWSATPIPAPYADFNDPQSLNLYGYVRGIPTTLVDADGHGFWSDARDFVLGAANAFGSDNLLGAGRMDSNSTAYKFGQVAGDGAAAIFSVHEVGIGVVGEVGGFALDATGGGAVLGVPVNIVSTGVIVHGGATGTVAVHNLGKALVNAFSSKSGGEKAGEVYVTEPQASGKEYVGRTTQGTDKRMQTRTDGRTGKATKVDAYKTKAEGRFKEQKAIDQRGGKENLDNKRNEVAPEKMKDLEKKYGDQK